MPRTPRVAFPNLRANKRRVQWIPFLSLLCTCFWCLSCRTSQTSPASTPVSNLASETPAICTDIAAGIDLSKQRDTRYQVTYADGLVRIAAEKVRQSLIGAN